jgi:uncharacterized protein YndB with AHSA1/START domain
MTIHLEITIAAPRAKIFAVLTDLPAYSTWLPQSSAFKGTTEVSSTPVQLGTTYLEPGPAGLRKGEIVEFEDPKKVTFHQPMSLKPYFLGIVLDVRVEMVLEEGDTEGVTVLKRDVKLGYPWVLWPFKVVVNNEFRGESWRTMELLKKHVEGPLE